MDKGYVENGFIVDLTHAKKTSEIIYELSRILDMQESKGKQICLKLGNIDLSKNELISIKTLINLMESTLEFISTGSVLTVEAANELDIKISEFTNEISAPVFKTEEQKSEVEGALDNIFGTIEPETTETKSEQEDVVNVVKESEDIIKNIEKELEEEDSEEIRELKSKSETLPTLYIRRNIRSGQSISSDGNIVIIGDVNPGAEIIAKGDITVWGILGGIAHSGSDGNSYTTIRALKLNPVQIRIGDVFARRPDTVNIPYVQKDSYYIPETAFAHKGSIIIKKLHDEN